MFLLLAEKKFNSSVEIQSLLEENKIKCDVVNCSSSEALLSLAEQLSPEIVMLDADFLIDDSTDIVDKLHQVSDGTYIVSLIDSEQFGKLHQAIEKGIDDYLFKPLQGEDVILKINIGINRKNIQDEKDVLVQEQALDNETVTRVDEKDSQKIFLEIADTFEQQAEEVKIISPSVDDMIEEPEDYMVVEPVKTDYDHLEAFSDLNHVPAQDETTIEPNIYDETPDEEIPSKPEPEGYVEDIEEYSPGEDVLDYYKGHLENPIPDSETLDQPEKKEEPVLNISELPESELESKVNLQEEKFMQIDDAELFGVDYSRRPVDTKNFEDLFRVEDDSNKKKKLFTPAGKAEKPKQEKAEDLFAADKESEITKPILPAPPNEVKLRDEDKLIETPDKRKSGEKPKKGKGIRFLNFLGNLLTIFLLALLLTLSFFLVQSRISGDSPEIAGYRIYFVLSGSMRPAFDTGSVIIVKPTNPLSIIEGDIITFSGRNDSASLTTHRVVGINRDDGLSFITRGDANNVNDPNPVQSERVIGVVAWSLPYLGYLFSFVQTRQGLLLLVFVPGLLILLFELRKIFGYFVDARAEKIAAKEADQSAEISRREKQYNRQTRAGEDDFFRESAP